MNQGRDQLGGPDPFGDTFVAMAGARAVITATRLGVLSALARERATPSALAAELSLDQVGIEALLTALAALGYVEAGADGTYCPTATGLRLAVGGSDSVAHFVGAYNAFAWEMLGDLDGSYWASAQPHRTTERQAIPSGSPTFAVCPS